MQPFDVFIAGAGIAGLYAALQFDSSTRVLVVSKDAETVSSSALAQGGVAAVLEHENDSYDFHFDDTMVAGHHQNNPEAVELLTQEGPEDVRRIMALGVDFDSDGAGHLLATLEGGHSRSRIVHRSDQTGLAIMTALLRAVKQRKNITLLCGATVCSVLPATGGFCARLLQGERIVPVFASYVLLATGGIGRVFRYTTNPGISTGDGIRFAHELGAKLKNMQAVQFHPTAFREQTGECFLISEAVRGEGAVLLNGLGERFMQTYDKRLELAPRDVVSRSILREQRRTGDDRFYLDITHKDAAFLQKRFPAIFTACLQRGVDITRQPIPVYPCQHYLMGGIDVDLHSRTTVPRLYAAGECAHTGLHGSNRLASNSLPEALVFGRRAAEDIRRALEAGFAGVRTQAACEQAAQKAPAWLAEARATIQQHMQASCFVLPDLPKIETALRAIKTIAQDLAPLADTSRETVELKSLCCVAMQVLQATREHEKTAAP